MSGRPKIAGRLLINDQILTLVRSKPELKERLRHLLARVGYDTIDWVRVEMYRQCFAFIKTLNSAAIDVLEVPVRPQWRRE